MAILIMIISVILWSFYPVLAAFGVEHVNIWEFFFWMELSVAIASYLALKVISKKRNIPLRKLSSYSSKDNSYAFLVTSTFILSEFCLLTSFFYISKIGATVIFEVWPIFAMYIAPILVNKSWNTIRRRDTVFTLMAILGIFIILYPEFNGELLQGMDTGYLHPYLILALPFIGGIFMAISSSLKAGFSASVSEVDKPIFSLFSAQFLTKIYGLPLLAVFALVFSSGESVYSLEVILAIIFLGVMVQGVGSLLFTWALLKSEKGNIAILWYAMPVFSAILFWLTGMSYITDYVVLGAIAIISCNLLISVKADNTVAYASTLFTIICTGIFCYFTKSFDMGEIYYEAVSVPIVFFVVMGAFIMDRSITRDLMEEEWGLSIINKIIHKAKKISKADNVVIQSVCEIMKHNNPVRINEYYNAVLENDKEGGKSITNELDKLVLSKLHSTSFGDIFITSLIGLLIIGVTVFFRPSGFIGDSFAIILTSSVVFMFFALVDFNNARKEFHINIDDKGNKSIAPNMVNDKKMDIIISAVIIAMVVLAFIFLLWFKYN